ncbi:aminotransferase class I/II-fold pyridoxal phosphate-dependent enzyme, partial [Frankia sp. Cpl3]|nr:aminotransferase class I/II-fold pyridoxal phosphate-dependent enzyme [Frankia sp. Cpl3]
EKELLYYGERQGEAGLRQEISKYLRHARGVQCTPDQIVIGAGTQFMIGLLCQMIGLSEKAIAMEDPGYQDVRSVISHHGFEIVPIPLEDDGIDVERLASSHANVVYITPSHQYPTGVVMPIVK